jgi:methyl-accepting chemotaxis protein
MTLSKQLFILISALFLMIFSVNFVISVGNMRSYLQIEAEVHAQDTATSLGLALSPYISNETDPVMETMMNAIFDMGYYKELKLVNAEGRPLVTLTNDQVFEEVPGWFIAMLPIETATAKSEISSGWSIGGTLRVTVNPGYAYLKLYHQAQSAFYYSMAAFIASSVLLMLVLRFILLPLKRISQLALAVSDGQYETMDRLPRTTEVRTVAGSMNAMSKKIGEVVLGATFSS